MRLRLLPVVTFCLCGTILFKSAGIIDAALVLSASAAPLSASRSSDSQGGSPGDDKHAATELTKPPYHPVANWTSRPAPPPLCKPDPLDTAGERKILLHLRLRAKALDARAAALDRQQQTLDAARLALQKQAAALKPLAVRLEALHAAHKSADSRKWTALVSTFATMDPRSAARIFDGLDPGIVLNVLKRMESRKSALILADMTPAKAQTVTVKLAGQTTGSARLHSVASLLPDGAP